MHAKAEQRAAPAAAVAAAACASPQLLQVHCYWRMSELHDKELQSNNLKQQVVLIPQAPSHTSASVALHQLGGVLL